MRIERRTIIDAPPSRVWDVLADWEGQAAWMPDVSWVRVVGASRAEGARLEVRTKILGIPAMTDRVVETGFDAPHRLAVEHRGPVKGRGEWRLEAFGSGTRFTWIEDLRLPPGPVGELALRAYGPLQRALLARSLRNLAALCEERPGR